MNVVLPSVRFKEPRHAVAVARVPKGSKRHTLLAGARGGIRCHAVTVPSGVFVLKIG